MFVNNRYKSVYPKTDFKVCCMFGKTNMDKYKLRDITDANLITVESYDLNNKDKRLTQCKECGAYVLVQYYSSIVEEFEQIDYFAVKDIVHARDLIKNNELLNNYPYPNYTYTSY